MVITNLLYHAYHKIYWFLHVSCNQEQMCKSSNLVLIVALEFMHLNGCELELQNTNKTKPKCIRKLDFKHNQVGTFLVLIPCYIKWYAWMGTPSFSSIIFCEIPEHPPWWLNNRDYFHNPQFNSFLSVESTRYLQMSRIHANISYNILIPATKRSRGP